MVEKSMKQTNDEPVINKECKTPNAKKSNVITSAIERYAILGATGIVIIVFGILAPSTFLTGMNFATILGSQAVLVVLTLGLLIPMTSGDMDLSIASVLTLSAMMLGVLNAQLHVPIVVAILAALAMGVLVGVVNGAFTILFDIDPFIVTLGVGTVLNGIVLLISDSMTISGISPGLVNLVVVKRLLGIPLEFYYGLILTAFVWYLYDFTSFGRRILFVGRGRNVARLSGIRVNKLRWINLMLSGLFSAFAGILYAGTTGAADPTSGLSYMLPAFAGVFLGSTSIVPGRFNPWGSFFAVYFLVIGITGLTILGLQTYVQHLFYGGALIIAVVFSHIARKRQEQKTKING
ncbi:ABC transporter permease [Phosphitispora fastidiosa]|uniref:ABC transporter permease n=1 Tax=Phosphitispora fastidiosa TaxID=2837202 RepID=UPI001E3270B6|nr:ABC transporter permease [Phosphitispora fastidiosa]MBU7008650.1 ribose transport system permease protein [Phosphitispora fastidiosa]